MHNNKEISLVRKILRFISAIWNGHHGVSSNAGSMSFYKPGTNMAVSAEQQLLNTVLGVIKSHIDANKMIPFGSQIVPEEYRHGEPNDLDYFVTKDVSVEILDTTGLYDSNIDIVVKKTINDQKKIKFTIGEISFDLILVEDSDYDGYDRVVRRLQGLSQFYMGSRNVRVAAFEALYFAEFGVSFNNNTSAWG